MVFSCFKHNRSLLAGIYFYFLFYLSYCEFYDINKIAASLPILFIQHIRSSPAAASRCVALQLGAARFTCAVYRTVSSTVSWPCEAECLGGINFLAPRTLRVDSSAPRMSQANTRVRSIFPCCRSASNFRIRNSMMFIKL